MTKSYSRDAQPYLDAIAAAVRAEQSVRDWLVFQVATGRACRQILHKNLSIQTAKQPTPGPKTTPQSIRFQRLVVQKLNYITQVGQKKTTAA